MTIKIGLIDILYISIILKNKDKLTLVNKFANIFSNKRKRFIYKEKVFDERNQDIFRLVYLCLFMIWFVRM